MEWVAIGIIVVWAIGHTYMDMQIKKKVEMMEKEWAKSKTQVCPKIQAIKPLEFFVFERLSYG